MKKRKPAEWLLDFVELPAAIFGVGIGSGLFAAADGIISAREARWLVIVTVACWALATYITTRKPAVSDAEIRGRRRNWLHRASLAAALGVFGRTVMFVAPKIIERLF